ncbi:hypothetical protein [Streptomyces sp. 3214.6]|uniref:hypothetical protein n=1 Tax=Streptomyces sp. 3214.6 TaxID=1882757 RepID=UPI00090B8B53|nr:hypothetical protein [Streptomyces sp. 3214.6]SHI68744.1 hypothetical protein SAMN05444521_8239 [Streptomyces sp. 3214.6]
MPNLTIGRTVIYRLSEDDARQITQDRIHNGVYGNAASEGDCYPAVVVRTFPENPDDVCNLKVLLDGPDTFWATSRHEGDTPGTWAWPGRV